MLTHQLDALAEKVLIELYIGKKRVVSVVASDRPPRVGHDTLQEIPPFSRHHLRDQEAAARVALARQHRVAHVPVHVARADLKTEEYSEKENNLRLRGPNLVLDHFVLDVSWRLSLAGGPVFHRNLDRLQSLPGL